MRVTLAIVLMALCGAPATADPVVSKLTANDAAAGDNLGYFVAIDGDTAVVGAPFHDGAGIDSGAAYVFHWTGTAWIQQAKLTASDAAAEDTYGRGVAISGDTIVVGSRFDDDAGPYSGSAYVYVRSGTTWIEQAKLTASDASSYDAFGATVAVTGDTIVVGAVYGVAPGPITSGAAYVFQRSGTIWTEQAKLLASDPGASDEFGAHVAISGDTIVLGARLDDNDAGIDAGSAYVFQRTGTTWTEQAKLTASDAAEGDFFGVRVAIDGDTAVVGAHYDDNDAGAFAGSAYVFQRSGTSWTEQAKLTPSDAAAGDGFGTSVAIDGDTIAVGSPLDDDAGSASGSAYVFQRAGTNWTEQAKLTACDAAAFDQFGYSSVAIDGDTIVVGAYQNDQAASPDAGAAYVFDLASANQPPTADAGEHVTIFTEDQSAAVLTGTASDPNGGILTCRWLKDGEVLVGPVEILPGSVPLALGELDPLEVGDHTFVFEVSDCSATDTDSVIVTMNNSPPVAAPTGGGTYAYEAGSTVTLGGQVADFDGDPLTYEWRRDGVPIFGPATIVPPAGGDPEDLDPFEITASSLGLGVHVLELVVDDGVNAAVTSCVEVEVIDVTAPTLGLSTSTAILWPPNHKMRRLTVQADVSDDSGGSVTLAVDVTSDEPPEYDQDGNLIPDHDIVSIDQATGAITLDLRAERQGKGDGRTYTIAVTATDEAGNSSTAVVTVVAPHDRGRR